MKVKREDPVIELEKAHEHWLDIYENGCFDPSWSDGINLNLVRNHMLYYQKEIEEQYEGQEKPAVYYKAIPDEVDVHYMANTDQILKNAENLFERLAQMQEVSDLLHAEEYLSDKEISQLNIRININRINALKEAIETQDYERMRSISHRPEEEIENVLNAHDRLMNRQHEEGEQLSLFDMMM